MEEILLREYMNRGGSMSDSEFTDGMRGILKARRYSRMRREGMPDYTTSYNSYSMKRHEDSELMDMVGDLSGHDRIKLMEMLQYDGMHQEGRINESQAKYIVANMYHIISGKKYMGEKYDMAKAKEVYSKYRNMFVSDATEYDVYVAINAQYHDYCELFKSWFGTNIDTRIIESAITFWFKDVDYMGENKVYEYFMGS